MSTKSFQKKIIFFKKNTLIKLLFIITFLFIIYIGKSEENFTRESLKLIYSFISLFLLTILIYLNTKIDQELEDKRAFFLKLYFSDETRLVAVFDHDGNQLYISPELLEILNINPENINDLITHKIFQNKVNKNNISKNCTVSLEGKEESLNFEKIVYLTGDNKFKIFEFHKNNIKNPLITIARDLEEFNIPVIICNSDGLVTFKNNIFHEHDINIDKINIEAIRHKETISFGKDKIYKIKILSIKESSALLITLFKKYENSNKVWSFLEKSTLGTAIIDVDFKIIKLNEAFQSLINNNENAEEKDFLSYIDLDEREKVKKAVQEVLVSEYAEPVDINLKSIGKNFQLHINKIEFNGDLKYVFSVIDTTRYKTLETNFVHSQKMQAIGQLAGAIAHDFNNLLTAMVGFCDLLLLRHPPGDLSFDELTQIKQNVNRAANLVRQLLAFSRKQVLQPTILELSNILAELSNLISRLIGENIELRIEHGKDLDYVKVDQGQLEQVIINLAVNARDAMINGGVLKIATSNIHISSAFDESVYYTPAGDDPITPGDYVLIEVSDNGCGIPDSVLDKIFEPFFSTKPIGAGTGLGLSTVYGIVKQTGGYIRLQTHEKKGTKFFIFLKGLKQIENTTSAGSETLSLDDISDKSLTHNLNWEGKILVVEDEDPVRIFSTHALTVKGYEVIEADCADAALKIIETEGDNIKMIITDVMMPGMTGPKMIEKIHKKHPNIKVIYISGYAEDAFNRHASQGENFHFLAKPFTLKQLALKVKEVTMNEE